MRKEELRKLRALPATKEMMEKGKRYQKLNKSRWNGETYSTIKPDYDALYRIQNLDGYVKIAVFLPADMRKDIKTPRYEIFLNVAGGEYITRELDDKGQELKWSSAMIWNLSGMDTGWGYWSDPRTDYVNRDALNTLNRLPLSCDRGQTGLKRLQAWQQEQKDNIIKQREQREQAPWDADMKLIPEAPKGFAEWMRKDAAAEYYIIYEYDPKGQKVGYCSKCKKMVPIKEPKHGKRTKCSYCGIKAEFKARGRIQTLTTGSYEAQIIQKFSGGIVVRKFWQRQWYRDRDYKNPEIYTGENERIMIFDNGTMKRYSWELYKNKFHRWVQDKGIASGYDTGSMKLYKRNFAQLKKGSMLKQSAIDLWPKLPLPAVKYIEVERGNPAVEMLARMGMFNLAAELIYARYEKDLLDENATEIAKMLKVDKSRLKRLKEMDGNLHALKWMQYEKEADTIWPDEMIKDFGKAKFAVSVFGFLNPPISFVKCHNYLKKQAALMNESLAQTLTTWRDYINMAEKLKMNTKLEQISRPKDLKCAHDECVRLKEAKGLEKTAKEIEKKWPKVNDQLQKLQKFEFTSGEYTIVAPKKVIDIAMEGTILKHCVHTCDYYFSRIQTDESYLFFLRKSSQPDMPWYTLEVEPSGNIRQKRTTGDNQNPDFQKAVPFLKKWQKFFRKQLTAEEKELGEKANVLREENYRNLRKNGNRVWHGKLAGKLLADVLEADFMAAV